MVALLHWAAVSYPQTNKQAASKQANKQNNYKTMANLPPTPPTFFLSHIIKSTTGLLTTSPCATEIINQ